MIANGRLSISVTKVMDGSNTIAENFSSKRELINAIAGSAFIPVFRDDAPPFDSLGRKRELFEP